MAETVVVAVDRLATIEVEVVDCTSVMLVRPAMVVIHDHSALIF